MTRKNRFNSYGSNREYFCPYCEQPSITVDIEILHHSCLEYSHSRTCKHCRAIFPKPSKNITLEYFYDNFMLVDFQNNMDMYCSKFKIKI